MTASRCRGALPSRPLFLLPTLTGGGAERLTAFLASDWAERGADVAVATVASSPGRDYALHPRVRRLFVCGRPRPVVRSALRAPFDHLSTLAGVSRLLRAEKPDLVVASLPPVSTAAVVAARAFGIPVVVWMHAYMPLTGQGRHWELLCRFLYARADRAVACSKPIFEWAEGFVPAARLRLVENPVRLSAAAGPGLERGGAGSRTLLSLGRLLAPKGLDRLVRAFALVAPRRPEWRLRILGEGPERLRLEEEIRRAGLCGRVELTGWVSDSAGALAAADLYAATSRVEGLSLAIGEAQSAGLATVAFDAVGVAGSIEDGVEGRLVADGDIAAFATALDELMGDDALRGRMGEAALARAHAGGPESFLDRWDEVAADIASR